MSMYQNLQSYGEVRLLHLHPGSGDDPLSASLQTCCLQDEHSYEALSYVWGDPNNTRPILCNGETANITVNLFSALASFRLPDKPRVLWADAICINQQDLEERASQVQIMHLVYKNCQRCLVWLGQEDPHVPVAVGLIKSIASIVCARHSIAENNLDEHLRVNGMDMSQAREIGFHGLPGPDPRIWGSLMHFFSRPWFSRAWVIQEVYFAPKVLFFCSNKPVGTYAALFHTADWLLLHSQQISWVTDSDSLSHYGTSLFHNVLSMRNDEKSQNDRWLEDVLGSCKPFDATDSRDKVYALMNLPPFQRECPDMVPSYHKNPEDIFADVAFAIITYRKSLSILTHVDPISLDSENRFPSWVPRWHREDSVPLISSSWYHIFWAGLSPGTRQVPAERLPGNILLLLAVEFDVIQDVCILERRGHQRTVVDKPRFLPTESWVPYDPSSSDGPYSSKVDIVSAYTMTLTAMTREDRGTIALKCPPESYGQHATEFVAWLEWLRSDRGVESGHYPPGLYAEDKPSLSEYTDEEMNQFAEHYNAMFKSAALGRSLVRTKKGFLGLARYTVQAGDVVCVPIGGALPLLLRRRDEGGYYYVGDVYVHGIMHGEALPGREEGHTSPRKFEIY